MLQGPYSGPYPIPDIWPAFGPRRCIPTLLVRPHVASTYCARPARYSSLLECPYIEPPSCGLRQERSLALEALPYPTLPNTLIRRLDRRAMVGSHSREGSEALASAIPDALRVARLVSYLRRKRNYRGPHLQT